MKIRFVSMRKYKMRLPLKYKLTHLFTINKYWSGQIWQFRFICTYGFDIDFRKGGLLDLFLTPKEKITFLISWFSKRN